MSEKYPSWFWYGRFEGAAGGCVPPKGFLPAILYLLGNAVGRRMGPPRPHNG